MNLIRPAFGVTAATAMAASRMSCASMPDRDSAMSNVGHWQTNSSGPAGGSGHVHHREIKECDPPQFRRGHGALYDALAAGQIDQEKLAALLTGTLPPLVDGAEGRAWVTEHDTINYGLLDRALAGLPAQAAAQVREACARWRRQRFAIDATPYPRPDAECSPGREHVHNAACRCDRTRKTIPGWEYQFTAAIGLQLEQLQQPGSLAGRGHHPQLSARVGQQQPGGGDVQQLHVMPGQPQLEGWFISGPRRP